VDSAQGSNLAFFFGKFEKRIILFETFKYQKEF
jgi:hypothetical protein